MSSLSGGGLSRGLGGGLSGTLRSFAFRPFQDPYENLQEWQLLERAGASQAEVERAKLEAQTVGPLGVETLGEEMGIEPEGERKGFIEGVFDFLGRGRSAMVGFVSGLAGAERERITSEGGRMIASPRRESAGLGTALRRFAEGITGEEDYLSTDFGILAYDREEAGLGERALKSAVGFVLDTALDPVTYMSMGGSIFGRARGAQRVFGMAKTKNRSDVMRLIDDMQPDRIQSLIMATPEKYGASTGKIAATLRERGIDVAESAGMDDIIKALDATPGALNDVAGDMLAANMAMAYRGGSSWGLRSFLKEEFGDAGMELFRKLPGDIQGGIRFRVPLSALGGKDPKILFRLPGTERLSALTNGTRDYLRNTIPGFRSLGSSTNGAFGASDKRLASMYYRSTHETSRKVWGEWIPDPESGTEFIGWLDVQDARKAFSLADEGMTDFMHTIGGVFKKGVKHVDRARRLSKQTGEVFEDEFDKALNSRVSGRLGDDGEVIPENASVYDVFGPNPTEMQQQAYLAAVDFQTINSIVKARLDEVFGDNESLWKAVGPDGEYWPRIVDDMNKALKGVRGRGGKPPALFTRERFFSFLNDDGSVGGYLTPGQVRERYGEEVFSMDPEKVMMAYMTSMSRVIRDEQITQNLINAGVAFRGTMVPSKLNEDAVIKTVQRVKSDMARRRAAAESIDYVGNVVDANRVYDAVAGWKGIGRRVYTKYNQVAAREGTSATYTSIDGTAIEMLDGPIPSYRVASPEGKYLTESGQWSSSADNARVFSRRTDAEVSANNAMREAREIDYQDTARELLDEFKTAVADDLTRLGEGGENLNALSPINWPIGETAQNDHVAAIVDIIKDYAKVDQKKFYSRPIKGTQYREQFKRSNLAELAGSVGDSDIQVRGNFATRWRQEGLLSPGGLVEDIQRMVEAQRKLPKWMEDFYIPFYSMQKSLMTSQRGPGYVIRNLIGGIWNAYLFGVSGKHWKGASVALSARNEAYRIARSEAPDAPVRQADIAIKKFREILEERLGKQAGKEMFDYYIAFDGLQLGGRSLRSRTLGVRADELTEGLPQDVVDAIQSGNVKERSFANVADYIGSRNRWAQFMTKQATESEDFLRFGAFLRGIDDFGFEDGGRLAGMYTLASQFDYRDLTRFERQTVKMIMPFYTWARYNIPLQARAIISEPGKVVKALRINAALADAFGQEPEKGEPLPVWVRAQMGWQIRTDLISGPMGDPLTIGLTIGEPLADINRIFGSPEQGAANLINGREILNSLNPIFDIAYTGFTGVRTSTGGALPQTEEAPAVLKPLVRAGLIGTVTPDGNEVISARFLQAMRDTLAPFGTLERLAPQFLSNERYQRRVLSSWASTLFGVPVSTLDPFQTGAELRTRQRRMQGTLERRLGENWSLYTGFVRELVERGATPADMAIIRESVLGISGDQTIADVPVERLDYTAARQTLQFLRRLEGLQELGTPPEVIQRLWENFEPETDQQRGVYAYSGGRQPLTPEQLSELGVTQAQVDQMNPEQLRELLRRAAGLS